MQIFKRDELIEDLLCFLDIPQKVLSYDLEKGIGPYDPEVFENHYKFRQEKEVDAEIALRAMGDEELLELSEAPNRLNYFREENSLFSRPVWYAGGFGVPVYKPDYDYWAKMDFWTLEESTCLSVGIKPEKAPERSRILFAYNSVERFFDDRLKLIQRAPFGAKFNGNGVAPAVFVDWARGKKLEIPPELVKAVGPSGALERPAMLKSVDRRQYESALKVILGLLSAQFGYEGGSISPEMKTDISNGLAKLGLTIDPKTLVKALSEAISARKRFEKDQQKRDRKDY